MATNKIPLINKEKEIIGYAKVSDEDYENVIKHKWRKVNDKYAKSKIDEKEVYLHSFLMGKPPKYQIIEHIDGDGLNNARSNLRFVAKSQDTSNQTKRDGCTSKYKGVIWHSIAKKWISWSGTTYLGSFEDEEDAGIKYDTYSFLKYGSTSKTNNLVKYDDVKDMDINSLLCTRKDRLLPKHIYNKRDTFEVKIEHKKKIYRSYASTIEDAMEKVKELKLKIANIDEEEDKKNNDAEITRNELGIAIIPIVDKKSEVVLHVTVSDDQWHRCMKHSWCKNPNDYFTSFIDGKITRLNKFIINAAEDELADHIDKNKLNNTTENLRAIDQTVNNHNKIKKIGASSQYIGVSKGKKSNKWKSEITKDGVRYNIGAFDSEIECAKKYNEKAKELYGEHAKLNVFNE